MPDTSPLASLLRARMAELGLDAEALGFRLGYRNPAKAAGRVLALLDGNVPLSSKSRRAAECLPEALDLPCEAVVDAVERTDAFFAERAREAEDERRREAERAEAEWRAAFRPHAVLHTERTMPSSITMCVVSGGAERWLIVRLDLSRPPASFAGQVLAALPDRTNLGADGTRGVMFFGRVLGFYVNYTPDRCVRFDIAGEPVEVLPSVYRQSEGSYSFGGRPVSAAVMGKISGFL